ncbi:NHL repeat protein [Maioricimonas rarisocia]|uniref:NHL repeat protein n=2 Tax=Maioricimonas rarisocia TaxID=2528026 RepID=A0A517ZAK5_9PLAN|nr:NHL repeat protein [Maioricimonas rarisocia]
MMTARRGFFLALAAGTAIVALTADHADAQNQKKAGGPRPFARNLDNPTGIVVHPETGHVFVAERRGIVRFFKKEDGKRGRAMQVNRFPTDIYGKGPKYEIGPLGVAFLGSDHLVVGDGSRPDGEELVLVYNIEAEAPEKPARANSAAYKLGPIAPGDDSAKGEGNFYGVVVTDDGIFITANGDDTKGWILRAGVDGGKPGELKPFIATKQAVEVDAPCGITTNSDGDLVVGQMGEISLPGDSLLTVYDAKTGKLKSSMETGLNDIVGLAYSPATGKLYAVDFSWIDTTKGGLFELTVEGDEVSTRKIAELDKPTAMAFDANGNLYVTVVGTAEEGGKGKPGKVLRFGKRAL